MHLEKTLATLERLVAFDTVSTRSNVELIDWVAGRPAVCNNRRAAPTAAPGET